MKRHVGLLLSLVLTAGCDRSMPTEPRSVMPTPAPTPTRVPVPDIRGVWHGTVGGTGFVCREPREVSLTLDQSGSEVSGTFRGGCLDGKTLTGHLTGVYLEAQAGPFPCPESGLLSGTASADRLALALTVTSNLNGGCTRNILFVSERVRVELGR